MARFATASLLAGQPLNTIAIGVTLVGDLNLDGKADSTDAITLARNAYRSGPSAWYEGDLNYDSRIDLTDATLLHKNFGLTMPPAVVEAPIATPIVVADPNPPTAGDPPSPATPSDPTTAPSNPTSTDHGNQSSSVTSKKHHAHTPTPNAAKYPARPKHRPFHKAR
jgi:hypothetical protein